MTYTPKIQGQLPSQVRHSLPASGDDPEANGRIMFLPRGENEPIYPWVEWHPDSARIHDPNAWADDMDVISLCLPADEAKSFGRACEIVTDLIELVGIADESPLQDLPGLGVIVGRLAAHVLAVREERAA